MIPPILTKIGTTERILFVLPSTGLHPKAIVPSHHPIMTATLAGAACDQNYTVGALDAALIGLDPGETAMWIQRWRPDWVWFVPFEYRRELPLQTTEETIRAIRAENKSLKIGLANCPRDDKDIKNIFESKAVNAVIYGDSETSLVSILKGSPEEARGILYQLNDVIIEDLSFPVIDWAQLPIPAWEIFEHLKYKPTAHRYKSWPLLPVMASRSCPYACDFCPQSIFNPSQKHVTRPVKELVTEIEVLIEKYKVKEIEFYDPTFGIKRDETIQLCRSLEALTIGWTCYTRCDLMDNELLAIMARSGCHTILFGVESGDVEILNRTQKELDHKDVHRVVKRCKELGIQTIASFILGLPGENKGTIKKTIHFSVELNPTFAQYHLIRSFFMHEDWKEMGTVNEEWDVTSSSVNGFAYIPNELNANDLRLGMLKAYGRFYLRPTKIRELMGQLSTRQDWKRIGRGLNQLTQHLTHM